MDTVVEIPVKGSAPLVMVRIPEGRFTMGSAKGLPHAPEGPEHVVEVRAFWMADAPLTCGQYEAVMGHNPCRFGTHPDLPVESVNWEEACSFCARLSRSSGRHLRLPSEAEWEYACRAGSTTEYHFGDSATGLAEYAWFEINSGLRTAPVRRKKPNAWGLYDMTGNVWEWCLDLWHEDYKGAPADGSPWMTGGKGSRRFCVRGGAWDMDAFRCRSSYRSYDWEDVNTSRTGFRVVGLDVNGRLGLQEPSGVWAVTYHSSSTNLLFSSKCPIRRAATTPQTASENWSGWLTSGSGNTSGC